MFTAESLDQLTEWVVDKFKNVRNKNIEPPSFPGHPLTKNELMVIHVIHTKVRILDSKLYVKYRNKYLLSLSKMFVPWK